MASASLWTWPETQVEPLGGSPDITGFKVVANDGEIGRIDSASWETDRAHIVVDTGPWIFGKKVMLPAGVIERVDRDDEKVYVNRSKDEIKDAPEFDENRYREGSYRDEIGAYYGRQRTTVGGGPDQV